MAKKSFQSTLPAQGSDFDRHGNAAGEPGISIHAPRTGERLDAKNEKIVELQFQSTLPAQGSDQGQSKLF